MLLPKWKYNMFLFTLSEKGSAKSTVSQDENKGAKSPNGGKQI